MPTYKDVDGGHVSSTDALSRVRFTLSWSDGPVVDCFTLDDDRWSVKRIDRGIGDVSGLIHRADGRFYWDGHAEPYDNFYEAARKLLQPV